MRTAATMAMAICLLITAMRPTGKRERQTPFEPLGRAQGRARSS